jgi:hypothetical protein
MKKLNDAASPMANKASAKEMVNKQRDDYLRSMGLHLGAGNPGNSYIGWAAETVSVPGTDASWAKARVMAYERGLIKAQSQFIRFEHSRILSQSVREIFHDDTQLNQAFEDDRVAPKDKWDVLKQKALALAEAQLDEALKKSGVDPAAFEGRKPFEKVTTLKDQMSRTAVLSSFGSLAGCRPLQTFEGSTETGDYAVGVLIVRTPKFADLAGTLASGRAKHIGMKDPQASIYEQIPKEPGALLNDFGVRVLVDESGDDCIVSFGQWSVGGNTSSERSREMMLDRATETARTAAFAAISDFAAGSLAWSNESVRTEIYEDYKKKYPEGAPDQVFGAEIGDKGLEKFKQSSRLNLAGASDIFTWRAKDPTYGHDIVGVVVMWSPTSQQQAKDLRQKPANGGEEKGKAGTRQGNNYDKIKDW